MIRLNLFLVLGLMVVACQSSDKVENAEPKLFFVKNTGDYRYTAWVNGEPLLSTFVSESIKYRTLSKGDNSLRIDFDVISNQQLESPTLELCRYDGTKEIWTKKYRVDSGPVEMKLRLEEEHAPIISLSNLDKFDLREDRESIVEAYQTLLEALSSETYEDFSDYFEEIPEQSAKSMWNQEYFSAQKSLRFHKDVDVVSGKYIALIRPKQNEIKEYQDRALFTFYGDNDGVKNWVYARSVYFLCSRRKDGSWVIWGRNFENNLVLKAKVSK